MTDSPRLQRLRSQADAGEAEAIGLALDLRADRLLIDDRKGRRLAQAEGVRCLGLPALLLLAKQRGLTASVAECLESLERRGHFYLSAGVRNELLRLAGE